jgi:hypothetical protein
MNLCLLPGSGKPLPHPDIAIEEEDDRAFPIAVPAPGETTIESSEGNRWQIDDGVCWSEAFREPKRPVVRSTRKHGRAQERVVVELGLSAITGRPELRINFLDSGPSESIGGRLLGARRSTLPVECNSQSSGCLANCRTNCRGLANRVQ